MVGVVVAVVVAVDVAAVVVVVVLRVVRELQGHFPLILGITARFPL